MSREIKDLRLFMLRVSTIVGTLATIALIIMIGATFQAQLLFALIWVSIIATLLITLFRIKTAKELKICGKAAIQGTWFFMSLSLSYIIITPAPYFHIPLPNSIVSALIGIAILIIGFYSLIRLRNITGVMISI